jgi:Protein of unknown function (DUF1236)
MKKMLLATVAVAALIAGPALAQRQEAPAGDVKGAAPPPAAIQNAPAEKVSPAGKIAPDRAADTKAPKSETTGQAAPSGRSSETDTKTRPGADAKPSDKPGMNADTKPAPNAQRSGTTTETAKPGAATDTQANTRASGNSASLTTEQKTKIRSTVLTSSAPRVSNVNFSINVGTVVPRTVRIVAVPAPLIEIHPAWRGYMYFVHGDDIIIVEPGTLRIVAVITA